MYLEEKKLCCIGFISCLKQNNLVTQQLEKVIRIIYFQAEGGLRIFFKIFDKNTNFNLSVESQINLEEAINICVIILHKT